MKKYIDDYKAALARGMDAINPADMEKIIGILVEAYKGDKQVFIAGNGGSAGTANHFVCDFGKNAVPFKTDKRRFRIISVSDNVEKITAIANDISFGDIFSFQLVNLMNSGDVLIAVSASGNSPDIVKACETAKKKGAKVIGLAGFKGGKLKELSDAAVVTPLESYEQIEDIQLMALHMIVYYFKNHQEIIP
jgi:D-sedoheptulose 7-phosphate isomerase